MSKAQVNCAAKRYFPDKRAAVSAEHLAQKKRGRGNRPEALHAYKCNICPGWHLTSKEPEEEEA